MSLKRRSSSGEEVLHGGVDTHSYCSGHMLMRVTGL